MGLLAVEGDGVALDTLGAEDGGEREAEAFEDGALLDVEFEVGCDVVAFARGVADLGYIYVVGGECGFEGGAVAVGAGAVGGDGVGAGEGGGAEEAAAEARAFLVGPVDDADGEGRAAVGVAGDRGEDFERGDDAERAVEPAAVGDGVEMAAEDEGLWRCAGEGDPHVASGVEMAGYREASQFRGVPVTGLLPRWGEGDALGTVGVGGEGG